MKALCAEVIGTFALVFTGAGALVVNEVTQGAVGHVGICLVFGLIVMAMVYSLGDISGAHINPAVTIAFWASGQFSAKRIGPYVAAQLAGACLAAAVLRLLFPEATTLGATLPRNNAWWQSGVLEFLLTFLLMFVILRVCSGGQEKGFMAGVVIGGVVALEALFAGPICGASMNPARSFGPAVVSGHVEHLWVYLTATTLGALSAVPASWLLHPEDAPGG